MNNDKPKKSFLGKLLVAFYFVLIIMFFGTVVNIGSKLELKLFRRKGIELERKKEESEKE